MNNMYALDISSMSPKQMTDSELNTALSLVTNKQSNLFKKLTAEYNCRFSK